MSWTDAAVATLKTQWADGKSASEIVVLIADRHGLRKTRSAVIGKVHRLGLGGRGRPWSPRGAGPARRPPPAPKGSREHPGRHPARRMEAPRRAVPPRPAPPLPDIATLAPTASLETLAPTSCRYPIGDPGAAGFGFCGRPAHDRGPYCAAHRAACRPPAAVREKYRRRRREKRDEAWLAYLDMHRTGAGARAKRTSLSDEFGLAL